MRDLIAPAGMNGVLFATDNARVYRSSDAGCTWTQVFDASTILAGVSTDMGLSANPSYIVATLAAPAYPGSATRVYAVLQPSYVVSTLPYVETTQLPTLLAESTDGGVSWNVRGGISTAEPQLPAWPHCYAGWLAEAVVAPSNPDTVYVDCLVDTVTQRLAGGHDFMLFRTTDAGASWTLMNPVKNLYDAITSVRTTWTVDPANANVLFHMTWGGMFEISHDGGVRWTSTQLATHGNSDQADSGIDAIRPAGSKTTHVLAWATDAGVFESLDGGAHWSQLGAYRRGGALQISDAAYLAPSGDAMVARTVGTASADGALRPSCTTSMQLTRYVGTRRSPRPWAQPPSSYGTLIELTGLSSTSAGVLYGIAWVRFGAAKDCPQSVYGTPSGTNAQSVPGAVYTP